jgi:hypothetical protein
MCPALAAEGTVFALCSAFFRSLFSRVSMNLRLTQGDENRGEAVFDCAEKDCPMKAFRL